ncbi:MAG: hypothetical protein QOE44_2585 [Solirubrobacteraceae bacterium]|jgi:DNA-binding beta-propeller fold protein YncE|nr:hypothetical protein [Solirubrobacteraceae bacterium]
MPRSTRVLTAVALAAATGLIGAGASPAAPAAGGSTCSTYFVASVLRGPRAGKDYAGILTLGLDRRGRLVRGSFVSLQGRRVSVKSAVRGGAISLTLATRDGSLIGTGTVEGSLRHCVGRMRGALRGPGRLDRGSWLATTGQTLDLPGGVRLFTSAETSNQPNPQVIFRTDGVSPATVFAGGLNTPGNLDGPRRSARMNRPSGLAYDAARSLVYVADVSNASIRRLDMSTGQVTTTLRASDVVAGAHAAGYGGVTGWEPQGVAVAAGGGGALLIADVRNFVIWRYNPTTLALKLFAGLPGSSGRADGSDTGVRFTAPQQITVDASNGLVVVSEPASQRVRLRDPGNGTWSTIGVCC